MTSEHQFGTRCVHIDRAKNRGSEPVVSALSLSTTFVHAMDEGRGEFEYSRVGNPSRNELESALAALEDAKHAICFSSGCAAMTSMLMTLRSGDHVVLSQEVYGGTFRLIRNIFQQMGIESTLVDLARPRALETSLRSTTRLIWAETPSNPLLTLVDIKSLSEVAAGCHAELVIDNTFATPLLQRPLSLGASVSLHSMTKYLNGHSDALGGVVMTNDDELASRLRLIQKAVGAIPSPFDSFLIRRGLKTLAVRLERQVQSATTLASFLESHPKVERVFYPGLASHPQRELAIRQMQGPGAMISFEIRGGYSAARDFLNASRLFTCGFSLGGVESLAEHPASMTHACLSAEEKKLAGVTDGIIRLSIGIEACVDLKDDLNRSLGE